MACPTSVTSAEALLTSKELIRTFAARRSPCWIWLACKYFIAVATWRSHVLRRSQGTATSETPPSSSLLKLRPCTFSIIQQTPSCGWKTHPWNRTRFGPTLPTAAMLLRAAVAATTSLAADWVADPRNIFTTNSSPTENMSANVPPEANGGPCSFWRDDTKAVTIASTSTGGCGANKSTTSANDGRPSLASAQHRSIRSNSTSGRSAGIEPGEVASGRRCCKDSPRFFSHSVRCCSSVTPYSSCKSASNWNAAYLSCCSLTLSFSGCVKA